MASTPKDAPKREPLPSRFIEGSELTRPDLLQRNPSLLLNILSEMDAFEKKRKGRAGSNSSVESISFNGSHPSPIISKREGRRSFGTSRPSLDEKDRGHGEEKLGQKVKGRLRAFTSGGREDGKSTMHHGI
jgi:hypothetical protein